MIFFIKGIHKYIDNRDVNLYNIVNFFCSLFHFLSTVTLTIPVWDVPS